MPSNWLTIDDSFPSFTGEESPTQQIKALHNYLFQLREGLRYSLQNLSAENFNASALQNLTESQKNAVTEELLKVHTLLSGLSGDVQNLAARVSGAENVSARVTKLEKTVTGEGGLDEKVAALEKTVTEEGGLNDRVTAAEETLKNVSGIVAVNEDGSAVVGAEGKRLDLRGEIYINGVLYTQGGDV